MKRWIPLIVILVLMGIAYVAGLWDALTFEAIKDHRQTLLNFVAKHQYAAPFLFIGLYILSTTLSFPIGIYLTFLAGFLFAQPMSTVYVVIGATIGASLIFLACKTALGPSLKEKAGPFLKKMESGFQENAVSYMLFIRLIPIFPFWLVNIAPAFLGVSFNIYFWTTLAGIIPSTFIFTQFGTGLGSIFEENETLSLESVLTTDVKIALVTLGIFVLVPVIYKKIKTSSSKS